MIIWSSLGVVIKLSGMPVHTLVFFSCIISSSIISTILIKKDYIKKIPRDKTILYLLLLALVSLTNTFTFFYSYKTTTIANAVLTHYIAPIIVAFISPIFLKERLTIKILIAVIIATAGLWIMLDVSIIQFINLAIAGDQNTIGILSGLISGFAYAILIIIIRYLAQNVDPILMLFLQNFTISLFLLPFIEIPEKIVSSLWVIGIMGIIHSTIAPLLYFKGMRAVTANRAAIIGYLEPVCAIILSIIFLNEAVNYQTVIGGTMIILSGYITIKA